MFIFVILASLLSVLATNLNICLGLMDNFNVACTMPFYLPTQDCCRVVSMMNIEGCFCNPYVIQTLGSNFNSVSTLLRKTCATFSRQPVWWMWAFNYHVDFVERDCRSFIMHTFNEGKCTVDDFTLETSRANALQSLYDTLVVHQNEPCFNLYTFSSAMERSVEEDVHFAVYYGSEYVIGTSNLVDMLSYINQGIAIGAFRISSSAPPRLQTSICGDVITLEIDTTLQLGLRETNVWCSSEQVGALELVAEFLECSTKIKRLTVRDTSYFDSNQKTGLGKVIQGLYALNAFPSAWNTTWMCNVHELYCTHGLSQFPSHAACLSYMESLATTDDTCTSSKLLAGQSILCKWKYAFLVPLRPLKYCAALGSGAAGQCADCGGILPLGGDPAHLQLQDIPQQLVSCFQETITAPKLQPHICIY